jgi:hypothetical protein
MVWLSEDVDVAEVVKSSSKIFLSSTAAAVPATLLPQQIVPAAL